MNPLFDPADPLLIEESQETIRRMIRDGELFPRWLYREDGLTLDFVGVTGLAYDAEESDWLVNLMHRAGAVLWRETRSPGGGGSFIFRLPFEIDWQAAERIREQVRQLRLARLRAEKPDLFRPDGSLDLLRLVRVRGWPEPIPF